MSHRNALTRTSKSLIYSPSYIRIVLKCIMTYNKYVESNANKSLLMEVHNK